MGFYGSWTLEALVGLEWKQREPEDERLFSCAELRSGSREGGISWGSCGCGWDEEVGFFPRFET